MVLPPNLCSFRGPSVVSRLMGLSRLSLGLTIAFAAQSFAAQPFADFLHHTT